MDPLSVTASVIAILEATTSVISFLNQVKDAPKERNKVKLEAAALYSLLTQLNCRVDEAGSHEAWYVSVKALNYEHGPLDLYKTSLKELQTKMSNKKFGTAIQWPRIKNDITALLSTMERLNSLVTVALEMDHFKLSQAIQGRLNTVVEEEIPRLEQGLSVIQHQQQDDKRDHILSWVSSNDYGSQLSDLINKKQQGTNQWFLDSPVFSDWATRSEQTILWCPGLPGAGKTIMAATTIEYLSTIPQSQVAYVFCNFKEQRTQTPTYFLATILQQLLSVHHSIPESVARLYEKHVKARTKPLVDEYFGALNTLLGNVSRPFLVIDALDECTNQDGTRSQFLRRIRKLYSSSKLRLMVTSRFLPEIADEFEHDSMLEIRASESDIRQFVNGQIYLLPKCVQRDVQLQQTIKDAIAKAADGMFLLASLHVAFFLDKKTKATIYSTLEELPAGSEALNKAYDEAVKRIESQLPGDIALAKIALSWIVHSQRSLTPQELCYAIAVEAGDTELNQDKVPDIEDIISACAGLIAEDKETNIVRLVHHTLQDYFLKIRPSWNPKARQDIASTCFTQLSFEDRGNPFWTYAQQYWAYHATHSESHTAEPALNVLSDERTLSSAAQMLYKFKTNSGDYQSTLPRDATPTGHEMTPPWGGVVNVVHVAAMLGLVEMLNMTLNSKGNHSSWVNSVDPQRRTPLSYSAEFGQDRIAKALLDRDNININLADDQGRTPLFHAVKNGHDLLVKLLLGGEEIEVNTKDLKNNTPLILACSSNNQEMVELLLQHTGIDVNARSNSNETPLLLAVAAQNIEMMKSLLKRRDININTKDRFQITPLLSAVDKRNLEMAKLLLERSDVDVNARNHFSDTPLLWAIKTRNLEMVKLLLKQNNIDVNAENHQLSTTPLSAAITRCNLELLQKRESDVHRKNSTKGESQRGLVGSSSRQIAALLIEREDLDINLKAGHRKPLLEAVTIRNHEILRLLAKRKDLDSNCELQDGRTLFSFVAETNSFSLVKTFLDVQGDGIHQMDNQKRTPLHYVAEYGGEKILRYLLEKCNSNLVRAKDRYGRTPLWLAAMRGHETMCKALIDKDRLDIRANDSDGRSMISEAAVRGRTAIVKLLLEEYHTNIDAKDVNGQTLLALAVQFGNETLLKYLLTSGASVNYKDLFGHTPIFYAGKLAPKSTLLVIEVLIGHGALVDVQDTDKRTPLWYAAKDGSLDRIEAFITIGASIDVPDSQGQTALLIAAASGHAKVAELLVSHGADMSRKDSKGRTALDLARASGDQDTLDSLRVKQYPDDMGLPTLFSETASVRTSVPLLQSFNPGFTFSHGREAGQRLNSPQLEHFQSHLGLPSLPRLTTSNPVFAFSRVRGTRQTLYALKSEQEQFDDDMGLRALFNTP